MERERQRQDGAFVGRRQKIEERQVGRHMLGKLFAREKHEGREAVFGSRG